ncbi:hypothetical protein SEA_PHINKY_35 [Microbacterium phage Phinky]|nr:hypothetical protein SEA_PHINKY_35 [Microbacterium phage Phinky]
MPITKVTAPNPTENADPWITARNTLDDQLKATANAAATGVDALEAAKGAANGLATLGPDSKLLSSQLPALAITEFLETSANQAAMLAKAGQQGDWTIRTDLGTVWVITGSNPAQLASWTQMGYPTAPVTTVNGKAGVVVLSATDVGALSQVDFDAYAASSLAAFEALETVVASKAAEADLTALQGTVTALQGTVSTVSANSDNAFQTAQAAQTTADEALAGLVVKGVLDHDETAPSDGVWLRRPAP